MINQAALPKDLKDIISNEQVDFIIKAKRNAPLKRALSYFFFSFVWLSIIGVGIYTSLKPYFKSKKFNLETIITELKALHYTEESTLIMVLFASVGVAIFLYGIYIFTQKGGYFVATKSSLIKYRNNKVTITDWNQFSGNTKVTNRNLYGDVALELITGKEVARHNDSSKRYVPNVIYIVGIENPIQIANKCRLHIDKNSQEVKF